MNQSYAEAGVKKKDTAKTWALRVLMGIGIVLGVILLVLGSFFSIIGLVLVAAIIFMFPMLNVEYEYVFVDGQIDFDRIIAKSKRKTKLRIDMEQVEIVAQVGSHALDTYTHVQSEVKDFSSGNIDSKPYVIMANVDQKKYKIIFEPSEQMLSMMKQKSPRKISQI